MKGRTPSLGGYVWRLPGHELRENREDGDGAKGGGSSGEKNDKKDDPKGSGGDAAALLAAEKARSDALQKRLDEIERTAAQRADDEKKKAAAAGDHQKVIDAQNAELDGLKKKLADLEGFASDGKAWREEAQKRIEAASKQMDAEWKDLLDAVPDVRGKEKVVARFEASKQGAAGASGTKPAATPPVNGSPPGATVDFAAAWGDAAKWADARARDPKGADAFVDAALNPNHARKPLAHLARANGHADRK